MYPLGPPLGRGFSCGAVACQVKGGTQLDEERLKNVGKFKKALRLVRLKALLKKCSEDGKNGGRGLAERIVILTRKKMG